MKFKTIKAGDKFTLIAPTDIFIKVGEVYEVGNILDNGIMIRSEKTKIALGIVSFETFMQCFSKKEDYAWSDWTLFIIEDDVHGQYKTNGKKVFVKAYGETSHSSCNKMDNFNLCKGLNIATLRCKIKALDKKINKKLEEVNEEIKEFDIVKNQLENLLK